MQRAGSPATLRETRARTKTSSSPSASLRQRDGDVCVRDLPAAAAVRLGRPVHGVRDLLVHERAGARDTQVRGDRSLRARAIGDERDHRSGLESAGKPLIEHELSARRLARRDALEALIAYFDDRSINDTRSLQYEYQGKAIKVPSFQFRWATVGPDAKLPITSLEDLFAKAAEFELADQVGREERAKKDWEKERQRRAEQRLVDVSAERSEQ